MFFSKKGLKEGERVARGHFHERVGETPINIGYLQALDLPQNLFSVYEIGPFDFFLGPTQFLYSKFRGLLKLIFHTNQYNGA